MPFDIPDNTGSLFCEPQEKISNKTGKPYKIWSGSCKINGIEMWISGFRNTIKTKNGDKEIYKLSFTPKQPRQDSASSFGQASDNYPF